MFCYTHKKYTAFRQGMAIFFSLSNKFEYWLFLHFEYNETALHRDDWNKKLTEQFAKYNLGERVYRKNYKELYEMAEFDLVT